MQATTNASLFQTSYSEALGVYRSRKAVLTSGISDRSAWERYGHAIQLNPRFESAVVRDAAQLAEEGAGADGGPYRVLSLRVTKHAEGAFIWTAEAGGVVRQLDAESAQQVQVFRGAKAPIPAIDFIDTAKGEKLLVTGSWDRAIRVYRIKDAQLVAEVKDASADFVKAIHVFCSAGRTWIAAAGSDKSIMLYDATPLTTSTSGQAELKCVHKYAVHTRPINALASLTALDGTTHLYSADSMGRIIESIVSSSLRLEPVREMVGFSTAVYSIHANWTRVSEDTTGSADVWFSEVREDDDGERYRLAAQVWAASGDKSAASYMLSPSLQRPAPKSTRTMPPVGTQPPLHQASRLEHADFVKTVLPIGPLIPASYPLADDLSNAVVTAGADEHIHLHTPTSSTSAEGHWHEVTALAAWIRHPSSIQRAQSLPQAKETEVWIVSAGLDGSVRRWNLAALVKVGNPELTAPKPDSSEAGQWDQNSLPPPPTKTLKNDSQMTAEEEAELAELISDDE
ncbi:hypothetical protein PaG_02602 [Moesziomyces aphidis]|uniref:WD40 repeat-like protein n=1 Tax=Moesziomyces aphidis TaxID=84754 RepID=W3VPY7_MOEAP|nr:hypothetical protein PaG_02602 [Moesziomyces aphidis]